MSEEKTSVYSISGLLAKQQQQHAYLIVISAKSAATVGRMFKLERAETTLGRSVDAGLQVEDDGISRKHCKVTVGASGVYQLLDLGSTNGTYVNGTRINMAALQDGD